MTTWLADSAHIFVYTVAALLPVANPVGMSAPFYAMTRHLENHERKVLARRVATYFFVLVLGTVLFGRLVLEIFSLTVGIVDIAGGLVLFHAAWGMLQGGGHQPVADESPRTSDDMAFFPLTMPLTADAAVLAIGISLGGSVKHHWDFHTFVEYGAIVCAIFAVALAVGLCYGSSHFTIARLGKTGLAAFTTISAFLLLAVGIEITLTGVEDFIGNL